MGTVEGHWVTRRYRGRVRAQHLLLFSELSNTCDEGVKCRRGPRPLLKAGRRPATVGPNRETVECHCQGQTTVQIDSRGEGCGLQCE